MKIKNIYCIFYFHSFSSRPYSFWNTSSSLSYSACSSILSLSFLVRGLGYLLYRPFLIRNSSLVMSPFGSSILSLSSSVNISPASCFSISFLNASLTCSQCIYLHSCPFLSNGHVYPCPQNRHIANIFFICISFLQNSGSVAGFCLVCSSYWLYCFFSESFV